MAGALDDNRCPVVPQSGGRSPLTSSYFLRAQRRRASNCCGAERAQRYLESTAAMASALDESQRPVGTQSAGRSPVTSTYTQRARQYPAANGFGERAQRYMESTSTMASALDDTRCPVVTQSAG